MEKTKDVFEYIKNETYIDKLSGKAVYLWKDEISDETVYKQAQIAVNNILQSKYTKCKKFYRIAGQSGSGKTTQLLPVILRLEKEKGNNPIIIAVRNFAKYHPNYDEIITKFEAGEMRERTNSFALKCLCTVFAELARRGYLIILDLTILTPKFEQFISRQLQDNSYEAEYHILAVSNQLSDRFIEKRKNDISSSEGGKIVYTNSKNYYYYIMPFGVDYLVHNDKTSNAFVWTAYNRQPIYQGKFSGTIKALEIGRSKTGELVYTEDELLQSKYNYLLNNERK